jgi:hypothetical protein
MSDETDIPSQLNGPGAAITRIQETLDRVLDRLGVLESRVAVDEDQSIYESTEGLHVLKNGLVTIRYLRQHCELLAPCVEASATVTRNAAGSCLRSRKGLSYLGLTRGEYRPEELTDLEDIYERAMFQKWSNIDGSPDCGWKRLLDYQVPVSDRRPSPLGLKAIDLLAVSLDGRPVVIELKVLPPSGSPDTPLRAILEAASYACVLQADWTSFRDELARTLSARGLAVQPPNSSRDFPLVIAAPPDYWDFWNNPRRRNVVDAKPSLRHVVKAFSDAGFSIRFVCVDGKPDDFRQLTIRPAQFLEA